MRNEEISLRTKQSLTTALKKSLESKSFSKVTITELIKECNINRNTFYYHFEDINALLRWMLEQEAIEVVKKFDLLVNTEEAIGFIMDYVDENKHIVNCLYNSMGYEAMKRFFYDDMIGVIRSTIDKGEQEMNITVDEQFKDFLAEFYTEAFAGMMINWVKDRETRKREEVLQNILLICKGSIPHLLRAKANETKS